MPVARSVVACAAALLLAACGGDTAPADEGGNASGEILPASASDAMIPTDQVRSQPPLMDPEPAAGATGEADGDAGGEGEGVVPADDAAPEGEAAAEAAPEAD